MGVKFRPFRRMSWGIKLKLAEMCAFQTCFWKYRASNDKFENDRAFYENWWELKCWSLKCSSIQKMTNHQISCIKRGSSCHTYWRTFVLAINMDMRCWICIPKTRYKGRLKIYGLGGRRFVLFDVENKPPCRRQKKTPPPCRKPKMLPAPPLHDFTIEK